MTTQQELAERIERKIVEAGVKGLSPPMTFHGPELVTIFKALRAPSNIGDATEALRDSLRLAIDNIQGIADGTDAPSTVIRERARALLAGKPSPNIGDAPRKESLLQIRGFAAVMDEHNWRDIKLHIERQCDDALRSNIGDACGGPNYLQALLTERLEVDRLRRDCAELYQVIGTLSEPHGPLFDDPQVIKALDNASAAANAAPRLHDDLLPFALTA